VRQSEPSRAVDPESLEKCYREAGTPADGRPTIWRRPFWASIEEEAEYLIAIRANPKGPDERSFNYVQRIARIVNGSLVENPEKAMPAIRQPGEDDE
jgi:hypothetical protein